MTHELKTNDEFMVDLASGIKSFEIRKNDRTFQVGDTLILRGGNLGGYGMTDHDLTFVYSGKEVTASVKYIIGGGQFGVYPDYCIMAIKIVDYNF